MEKYDKVFFKSHQTGSRKSADKVVPLIIHSIRPNSVIDVGCGTGDWLSVFLEKGVENVLGLDGDYVDKKLLSIPESRFKSTNLEDPIIIDSNFDLAISLEVAEHLRPQRAPGFVADLVRLAPVIVFSAAIPGQGGTNHLNEQWPGYWENIFNQHNYVSLDYLRKQIWEEEGVAWWYAQNIVVYVNENQVNNYPFLKDVYSRNDRLLPLVHPKLFSKVHLGLSQNKFRRFLYKAVRLIS